VTDLIAMLMLDPMVLNRWQEALMLWPLCLAVSIVYKTTKCETVREIPAAAAVSSVTIVVGMYVVGVALLVLFEWAT
jgi:hypothetical protein